ncbi:phage tail tape measure protein [Uliginosibacterium gangwonense]|uniref:phage tail tape measure protein n=1 Tax=Uliginosibacterium gangwonense TaxID=392736 RepID=UPI0012F901D2|nr:phage tail tape measure protein [Uliginosibacterium gangwonense]
MDRLKLEVVFGAIDRLTRPLRQMSLSSQGAARALRATREQLKQLDRQQAAIKSFHNVQRQAAITSNELKTTQSKIKELTKAMAATANPTREMAKEMEKLKARGAELRNRHSELIERAQRLRTALNNEGISTRNLAEHQARLNRATRETNATLQAQQQRLERLNRISQGAHQAGAARDKLAGTGVGMMAAGGGMLMAAHVPLDEAKKFQGERTRIAALGLGTAATKEAEEYARAMKVIGTSTTDNMTLVRDATTIFADTHHAKMVAPMLAKMKFANEAVFGKEGGAQNEEQFMNMMKVVELRGGTKSEGAFKAEANRIQQVITATGGRVGADQWRDLIKTGGVAAKQMRSDAFYNQLEPLVQEMGGHAVGTGLMSAYQGIYQGKTTVRAAREMERLGLLDKSKVEYDKVGQLKRFKPGALLEGELFTASPFEWLQKVLLPKLAAKGITDPGKINDAIASIFSNRTAANLMATMVMQRDQIHKSAKLSMGADGIEELHAKAMEMASGKELIAQAKLRDIMLQIGEQVLPVYMQALDAVNQVIDATSAWIKENPELAKWISVSAVAIGGLLVVLGGLLLGIAALLAPFAMVGSAMAGFSAIAAGFAGAWAVVTGAISASTVFLMENPLIAIVGGIAIAALLIWKYWEPLKAFFLAVWSYVDGVFEKYPILNAIFPIIGAARTLITYWEPIKAFFLSVWAEVQGAFSGGIAGIAALCLNWSPIGMIYRAWAAVLSWFGVELPSRFTGFGTMLMDGIVTGISRGLVGVKTAIFNAGDATVNWFKEKLGIHSPSRVFATLGHYTMQGLDVGLQAGQRGPLSTVNQLTRRLMAASATGVGVLSAAPISAAPPVTPIQMSQAAPQGANSSPPIVVHIHAAPGMDEQALAKMVAREIERAQRQKDARSRARLIDN